MHTPSETTKQAIELGKLWAVEAANNGDEAMANYWLRKVMSLELQQMIDLVEFLKEQTINPPDVVKMEDVIGVTKG